MFNYSKTIQRGESVILLLEINKYLTSTEVRASYWKGFPSSLDESETIGHIVQALWTVRSYGSFGAENIRSDPGTIRRMTETVYVGGWLGRGGGRREEDKG